MKRLVVHPFLFAFFPVLFLYARNADQMRIADILMPAGVLLVGAAVLTGLTALAVRNVAKGGFLVTWFFIAFFSHGPLRDMLSGSEEVTASAQGQSELMTVWLLGIIWLVVSIIALKRRTDFSLSARLLNYAGAILIVVQVVAAGYAVATRSEASKLRVAAPVVSRIIERRPDIYYIITDGYVRHDVLKEIFDYDNSTLRNFLTSKQFYIADSAHSNYPQTLQSLTSSLSMNFLDSLADFDRSSADRVPLADIYQESQFIGIISNLGYTVVALSSGYDLTELHHADITLSPTYNLSEFSNLLLATTPLPFLFDQIEDRYEQARNLILFAYNKLPRIDEAPSPIFVMAHIIAPHPPFLFDADGNPVAPDRRFGHGDGHHFWGARGIIEEYLEGYPNQVRVIDSLLMKAIDGILSRYDADNQPIILVQADHGSGARLHWNSRNKTYLKERFSILSAYYLPHLDTVPLYPSITPVNSFRLILNSYFGTDYELLPDISYFTVWSFPYKFEDVTDLIELPFQNVADSIYSGNE